MKMIIFSPLSHFNFLLPCQKIYTSIISKLYYIPGYADSCFHILYIISDNYFTELAEKTSQISWRCPIPRVEVQSLVLQRRQFFKRNDLRT